MGELLIERLWRSLLPRHYFRAQLAAIQARFHEPELKLLPALAQNVDLALDIGAAEGTYTAHLLKYARTIFAFEPRPRPVAKHDILSVLDLPIRWESVALSDREGEAALRMLAQDPGRSTIESTNRLDGAHTAATLEVIVPMRTLDSYALTGVGFMKIDVEGHELAVLEGATTTIEAGRPTMLIESEGRHSPGAPGTIFSWLRQRGYVGYFLNGGQLVSVEHFDPSIHQDPRNIGGWESGWERRGTYVNNFIFIPVESRGAVLALATAIAAGHG